MANSNSNYNFCCSKLPPHPPLRGALSARGEGLSTWGASFLRERRKVPGGRIEAELFGIKFHNENCWMAKDVLVKNVICRYDCQLRRVTQVAEGAGLLNL